LRKRERSRRLLLQSDTLQKVARRWKALPDGEASAKFAAGVCLHANFGTAQT